MSAILRPSSLPKIAVCPSFQSKGGDAGGPAERGTLMDEAFRHAVAGDSSFLDTLDERIAALSERFPGYQPEPGRAATEWTIQAAHLIDSDIETREDHLRVTIAGIPTGGTADMLFPSRMEHGDMKTGQIRNYREQMAAYALGFMDQFFADRWRAHLLFCDQRQIVTHDFTREEARGIVRGVIAEMNAPDRRAVPNEYCKWCGLYETCHARRELAMRAFTYTNIQERWEVIKEDPEELAAFLLAADALSEFVDEGKRAGLSMIEAGAKLEGWKRVSKNGNEFVDAETLIALAQQHKLALGQVVRAFGNLSGGKARELFTKAGAEVPARIFQRHGSSIYLAKNVTRKKKPDPEPSTLA